MQFNFSGATATDSLSAGYRTVLIDDCCRGVDLTDIESTKETVLGNHGVIVSSREVKNSLFHFHSLSFHQPLPYPPPHPQKPQHIGHIQASSCAGICCSHDFSILK